MGVAVGLVNAENLDATFGIGVFADLGTMTPRLGLETRLDYWSQSEDFYGSELSIRDITIGARGKYHFPVSNTNIRPFMGAGLGLHMVEAEVGYYDPSSGTTTTSDDSDTKLGLDLGGGISTPLNPSTDLLAELWFGLVSDFDQVSLRFGLSHAFGR